MTKKKNDEDEQGTGNVPGTPLAECPRTDQLAFTGRGVAQALRISVQVGVRAPDLLSGLEVTAGYYVATVNSPQERSR